MACFVKAIASADLIVAHNISFDYPVVNCELIRLGIDSRLSEVDHFCTMMSTVELCKIPGVSGYKWPKLQELYRFLFNAEFSDAHSALADANATADCFIELSKRNLSSSAALTHPLITLLAEMPSVLQSVWNWSLCRCSIQQAISFLPSFGGIILLSISACSKCHRRSFV